MYVPLQVRKSILLTHCLQEAIQYAIQEFRELDEAKHGSISIYVTVTIKGQQSKARISAMAWPEVAPNLASFEVLDIIVEQERSRQNPRVIINDASDLPPYTPDEKRGRDFLDIPSHSESTSMRSHSPTPSTRCRSPLSRVMRLGRN